MLHYRALVRTIIDELYRVTGAVDHRGQIHKDAIDQAKQNFDVTSDIKDVVIYSTVNYDLVIFSDNGTLTTNRDDWLRARLLPNVGRFLLELNEIGVKVGVASNKSQKQELGEIVDHMTLLRNTLHITPNLATFAQGGHRCKPAPNMLQELMLVAGVEPEQTLFVGDQDSDKQAAEAAGVEFIYAEEFFGW